MKTTKKTTRKKKIADGSLRTYMGNLSKLQNKKDVISNSQYTYESRILQHYLENLYQQSWIAKRLIELPVDSAMSNGFKLTLKNKDDEKRVWKLYKKLNLDFLIRDTQKWADVYGSSVVLFKNEQQDPLKPYTDYKNLEFVQVQYPFYMPLPKLKGDVYESDRVSFNLLGVTANIANLAYFYGAKSIKRLQPQFKYFGMSVFQNIWRAIISDDLITTAVANIIYRSSLRNYKLKGFRDLIKQKREDIVLDVLSTTDLSAGIFGSTVTDSEDTIEILTQSIQGLADLDRRSAERLSSATGIPATILLGKSPTGMNATGQHDTKNFYIFVSQYQKKMLPAVKKIFAALLKHLGIDNEDWDIEFNKPQNKDEEQEANIDSVELDNASKLRDLTGNQKIVYRYLKEKNIITPEEFEELEQLRADFDENNRFSE